AADLEHQKLRLIQDLNKVPLPRIAEELIRLAQRKRILLTDQLRQQLHRTIRDEQVEPTIVIVIKEERAKTRKATPGHSQSGFARAIFEERPAQIHVKRVGLIHQVRDKDVFKAIAVDVRGIDTHSRFSLSIPIHGAAGQQRLIHKRSILLVDPE